MTQDFTNPFKNYKQDKYLLIAAGEGVGDVEMPDGSILSATDVKRNLGYPQLFAWNLEPKPLLEWVEYLKKNPNSECKLVVDSGAYSAWSRGKPFDIDEYINFLNSNDVIEQAFWCAEADVIPGSFGKPLTFDEIESAAAKSWKNYLYMIDRVKIPKKIVPIFHQGEDFKWLVNMLEYTFKDEDHIPYIGISASNIVSVKDRINWYEKVWKIIKESKNPEVLTHNFGMTIIPIMEQYPSCSSDSTTWLRSSSFGNILIVTNGKLKTILVSDRKILDPSHIYNQSQAVKDAVESICKKVGHGLSIQDLVENDSKGKKRQIFNLYSLNDWRINFKYSGNSIFKESLW